MNYSTIKLHIKIGYAIEGEKLSLSEIGNMITERYYIKCGFHCGSSDDFNIKRSNINPRIDSEFIYEVIYVEVNNENIEKTMQYIRNCEIDNVFISLKQKTIKFCNTTIKILNVLYCGDNYSSLEIKEPNCN